MSNQNVSCAAAIPINHSFYGESFKIHIELLKQDDIGNILCEEVEKFIHEKLDKFKWPEEIIFTNEIPKTPSGKIKKYLLQDG